MDIDTRTDAVHREILGFLPADLFDFSDLDAGIARVMGLLGAAPAELPDTVSVEDHSAQADDGHEVTVRIYRPAGAPSPSPVLYWIHGGGLILGAVGMDDGHCADIATRLQIVVASVDYRLAPQWPYPTPIDDCEAGLRWMIGEADRLGIDTDRLVIGGGSAGGGLAAALAIRTRDRGEVAPVLQLLRYPMIDDRNTTESSHDIVDGRVWNRAANLAGWNAYLEGGAGGEDVPADAAPARATDLAGLPPAMVTVGALDLFLDEDIAYARALLRAGVPTDLRVYPNAFHGSDVMVAHAEVSQRWRQDELDAIIRAITPGV
jgi:acetyl esterase/lipase